MKECSICYEVKMEKFLPCSHSVCHDCYDRLQGDNCPYCRKPFRQSTNNFFTNRENEMDPEYWLNYDDRWVTYSRYLRNGNEVIRVFRRSEVPESWRNDDLTTIVRNKRVRRLKRIRRLNQ